jgi:cytochrome bd ubiquinol oxidase subunit II
MLKAEAVPRPRSVAATRHTCDILARPRGQKGQIFIVALGLFAISYLGIAISLWPMIVSGHFSLEEAAASPSTQAFLLIGTLVLPPVILLYTSSSYWAFRGKVRSDVGYH